MEKEKIRNEIEEIVLFTEEEAEKIAKENIGLIHHIIGTLSYNNFDYTELYDVGLYGYAKAIKSFNKNKDILFSTYACNCIRNEILLFIKKETKHLVNDVSLNKQIANGDHKDLLLEDIITDDNSYINNVEKLMINEDTCRILKKVIENLDYDEQFVVCHRYGILGYKLIIIANIKIANFLVFVINIFKMFHLQNSYKIFLF